MLALQNAVVQLSVAKESVARLDRFLEESADRDAASLSAGRRASELQFAVLLREQLRQLRVRLQEEVARLEVVRQELAAAYEQAFRQREVLENLRNRMSTAYEVEQGRREQRRLDIVYLLQRWHHRKG
ncbi:MAG TPA: flagellar FliJ family protein [Terriglobales bacterium]|nr:flagellar FliJ family protein [Terriglobales bacterium]